MAIRLASAIGQQREPIGILGGLDEAVNKTGDDIQAIQQRKAAEEARRKEQEQKMRDEIIANVKTPPPSSDMHPDDWARRDEYAKNGLADLIIAKNSGVSNAELEKRQREYLNTLQKMDYVYERDWKTSQALKKAADEGYLTKDMDMFMAGQTDQQNTPPQISQSQQNGGYGVPTEEEALGKTEFTGTPHFQKPLEERLKVNIDEEFGKRVIKPVAGVKLAAKDVFSEEFNPDAYVVKTTNKEGGLDFSVNADKIEKDAQRYAIQMVGDTNWGKNHKQTKDAMEYQAVLALRKAGLQGEELAAELPKVVAKIAYEDYKDMAIRAADDRMKDQKEEPLRREGEGIVMNFTSGGGASKGSVTIEPVKDFTPSDKEGIKIAEKQTSELKESIKKANEIVEKYKNNTSSPAYKNAKKSLDASRKALIDLEEENLSREKGFLMFSNKKAVDDAFIDINNDGKTMYRVIGFKPKEGGGYEVLGVERINTDDGKVDKIKNMELTESVYRKIIAENPDADAVMNKLGVSPKAETKAAASKGKQYKIADVTVDFVNKLKDGEIVVIDGIEIGRAHV